jgi:hypothetical protein
MQIRHFGLGLGVGELFDPSSPKLVRAFFQGPSEPSDGSGSERRYAGRIYNISNVPESDIQKVVRGASLVFGILICLAYWVVRRWF